MCGLIGAAGELTAKEKGVFTNMFFLNTERGRDGCGVIRLYHTTEKKKTKYFFNTHKSPSPSSEYVYSKDYSDILTQTCTRMLCGHSRWATIGGVKIENNHPFTSYGKDARIVGMHNGTIRGRFDGTKDFDTDSEALIKLISDIGLKKALLHVYEEAYDVAYALVIYNPDENSISLIRNEKRPLYILKHDSNLYWTSDPDYLTYAMCRQSLEFDESNLQEVKPHTLVKFWPLKERSKRLKVIPNYLSVDEINKAKDSKTWYSKGSAYNSGYRGGWYGGENYGMGYNQDLFNAERPPKGRETRKKYIPFYSHTNCVYQIGNRHIMGEPFENHILSKGCAICGDVEAYIPNIRFNNDRQGEYYCYACKDTLKSTFDIKWEDLVEPKIYVSGVETPCGDQEDINQYTTFEDPIRKAWYY